MFNTLQVHHYHLATITDRVYIMIYDIEVLYIMTVFIQVARAWQPSIVFIGDCERTWVKKVPKTDKVCEYHTYIAILNSA